MFRHSRSLFRGIINAGCCGPFARDQLPTISRLSHPNSSSMALARARQVNFQLLIITITHASNESFSSVPIQSAPNQTSSSRLSTTATTTTESEFGTIILSKPEKGVAHIELNNPKSKNAFGAETAREFLRALDYVESDRSLRCVILSGNGDNLTSGVDLKSFMGVYANLADAKDVSRKAKILLEVIETFQEPFKRMYKFRKPVICVQHGLCLGLGMELAACSDIRICTSDVKMSIREVIMGIAADVGSLQLLPKLVKNQSLLRELIFTGRFFNAQEALELGFVSKVINSKSEAITAALDIARNVAKNSPVAVQGSKQNLRFSGETTFQTGLEYNAVWNMSMMQSEDLEEAIKTIFSKSESADYSDF